MQLTLLYLYFKLGNLSLTSLFISSNFEPELVQEFTYSKKFNNSYLINVSMDIDVCVKYTYFSFNLLLLKVKKYIYILCTRAYYFSEKFRDMYLSYFIQMQLSADINNILCQKINKRKKSRSCSFVILYKVILFSLTFIQNLIIIIYLARNNEEIKNFLNFQIQERKNKYLALNISTKFK